MNEVDAGELDQLITIKRETLTDDGMGGQNVTLTNVATNIWAKVRALSGKEFERYDKLNNSVMTKFIIRYRSGIREDDRIVWNSEEYNIRFVPPVSSRSTWLFIDAEKGVAL